MLNHRFSIATVLAVTIVVSAVGDEKQNKLSIVDDGKTLTVRAGDDVVLKYNIAAVPSPIEDKPYYARSGHIHPVYSPQGHIVTGDMCPDHRHQHAIWFAWTNTRFQGRKIDFWNSQAQQGRIEHAEVLKKQSNDGEARFQVRLRHLDVTDEEPKEVLRETWDVRVRAVEDVYVIDLESRQHCASESPLLIKKYHYGAMGLRAPMAWNAPDGDFLTSEGKTRASGNHTRPKWVDSYGPVESEGENPQIAGITVMQHPLNFRYPQPARLHPKFSYFCFAPMVLGDFSIEPNEPYVSHFRYVVHDGPIDNELTERLWKDFANADHKRIKLRATRKD